jgi:hypothetical protein
MAAFATHPRPGIETNQWGQELEASILTPGSSLCSGELQQEFMAGVQGWSEFVDCPFRVKTRR